ncbi:MAG: phosphodiester glycosidase family protein [Chloroflexota bacterium]
MTVSNRCFRKTVFLNTFFSSLKFAGVGFLIVLLFGCQTAVSNIPTPIAQSPSPNPSTSSEQVPQAPISTPTLSPTSTPAPNQWQTIHPGIEKRTFDSFDAENVLIQSVKVIRVDTNLNRFELAYQPNSPQSIQSWMAQLDALVVVNGSFFTPEYLATGLIVVDGVAAGQTYGDFAGMMVINDGRVQIQDLAIRPYSPNDPIEFGIQTFPVLVKNGGQIGYTESGEAARRTVLAVDGNGRVLIIITQFGAFSLAKMSEWLVQSDLDIDIALNLDGGNSSSLAVVGEDSIGFLPIPNVIAVYPR